MQKAAISARSGRRSGSCYASLKRAISGWIQWDTVGGYSWIQRVDTVGYSGREGQGQGTQWEGGGWPGYSGIQWVDTVGGYSWIQWERGQGAGDTKVNRNGERKRSSVNWTAEIAQQTLFNQICIAKMLKLHYLYFLTE